MNVYTMRTRLVVVVAVLEALLVARLVALLFAANPKNPFVALVLMLSTPLAAPFSVLDVHQPTFGSRFERGTLLMICILPLVGYLAGLLMRRAANGRNYDQSHRSG